MDSLLNLWLKNERNLSALSNIRKIFILLCTILRKSFCPQGNLSILLLFLVKFPHSPKLHYAFSSWIEKTMKKAIQSLWKNRFVLQ